MFKYLWIIMLAIPVLIFIYYTIKAIQESFNETIHCAKLHGRSIKDIRWILIDTWSNFEYYHGVICALWSGLVLFGILLLFAISFTVYLSTIGIG